MNEFQEAFQRYQNDDCNVRIQDIDRILEHCNETIEEDVHNNMIAELEQQCAANGGELDFTEFIIFMQKRHKRVAEARAAGAQ